ncbi:hypothetical protein ACLB9X_19260 [Streptomyces sp. 5K101]
MTDDRALRAAHNNAAWCETMCRAHGLPGAFAPRAWTNPRRTPPLYPDAVTLTPDASAADALAGIDTASPGASVKDSFACLDLTAAGFELLFEAQWLYRPAGLPAPAAQQEWSPVATAAELAEWATAWDGGRGLDGVFRTELLSDPATTVLVARDGDGRVSAGAVLSTSPGAAGISNLFTSDDDLDAAWAGCVSAVTARCPDVPVVGYEHGDDLAAALATGCEPAGDLRVWTPRRQRAKRGTAPCPSGHRATGSAAEPHATHPRPTGRRAREARYGARARQGTGPAGPGAEPRFREGAGWGTAPRSGPLRTAPTPTVSPVKTPVTPAQHTGNLRPSPSVHDGAGRPS